MKNIIKFLGIASVLFASNIFAATNAYKVIVKQIDLCTDWACTAPFNMFTGSKNASVGVNGVAAGSDIAVQIPVTGSNYNRLRMKISTTFILDGSAIDENGSENYCATGQTSSYANSTLSEAAATEASVVMPVSGMFSSGNGVDSAGALFYGSRSDQTSLSGYTAKSVNNTSTKNAYTMVLKQDTLGDDTFYITTVLKGDFDYGTGKLPSTVNFGVTVSGGEGITAMVCNAGLISAGMCSAGTATQCLIYPNEPVFDFTIQ